MDLVGTWTFAFFSAILQNRIHSSFCFDKPSRNCYYSCPSFNGTGGKRLQVDNPEFEFVLAQTPLWGAVSKISSVFSDGDVFKGSVIYASSSSIVLEHEGLRPSSSCWVIRASLGSDYDGVSIWSSSVYFSILHTASLIINGWWQVTPFLEYSSNNSADLGLKSFFSDNSRIWGGNSLSDFLFLTFRMMCRGK